MSRGLKVCVLTPPGRGAVAVVRLEGDLGILDVPSPLFRAANGKRVDEQQSGQVSFGHWGGDEAEEVVFTRLSEDVAEVHCHGGRAAVQRLLDDLQSRGAVVESPEEQIARTLPRLERECLSALLRTTTRRTAAIVAEQQAGLLRRALTEICHEASIVEQQRRLEEILRWSRFGRHLTVPWSVVLCGRPNVGKSSLINALMGYARSIVFDQPGTTRDIVTAETALDGWPVELSDTAGLRSAADEIEREGIERARRQLATADVIMLVLDRSLPPEPEDHELLRELAGRAIIVANKSDLPDAWREALPAEAVAVSSQTGDGLDCLIRVLTRQLVPESPEPGTAVPVTERLIAGLEKVRNRIKSGDRTGASELLGEWLA